MQLARLGLTAALLMLGGVGGFLASLIQMPMPWMLGSLLSVALLIGTTDLAPLKAFRFPSPLRAGFVALIGVMIGAQISPSFFQQLSALPWTISALILFVLMAQGGNQLIFTRLGRLDPKTAFFSGTPGGLLEAILMSEQAGADDRVVMLQRFLRVILVIFLVPLGLSLWAGEPLGSAAGLIPVPEAARIGVPDLIWVGIAAAAGLMLGRLIHLPAAQITGPMLTSAALTLAGLVDLQVSGWLIALAQVVIGVALGSRFIGISGPMIRRAFLLCLTSVLFMLSLGLGLATLLTQVTGIPFVQLFLAFAPGGVTEMSLVALSLALNPTLISLHHILRILVTVFFMGLLSKALGLRPKDP